MYYRNHCTKEITAATPSLYKTKPQWIIPAGLSSAVVELFKKRTETIKSEILLATHWTLLTWGWSSICYYLSEHGSSSTYCSNLISSLKFKSWVSIPKNVNSQICHWEWVDNVYSKLKYLKLVIHCKHFFFHLFFVVLYLKILKSIPFYEVRINREL